MDKLNKKVLKYAQETSGNRAFFWLSMVGNVNDMAKKMKENPDNIRAAVYSLNKLGLVEFTGPEGNPYMFYLTHAGVHYKEIKRLEALERWKERFYGFLFGIALTLVTTWLTGLLSL